MLEIVICDSDDTFTELLMAKLKNFYDDRDCGTEIRVFSDEHGFMDALEDERPMDLLFLNTKLGAVSGFTMADLLRLSPKKKQCELIFISEDGKDVFETFFYRPAWCLRKQFWDEELDKALKQMWKLDHRERSILVREGRSVCYVHVDNILYLASDGHYVCIQCLDQSYRVRDSMAHFEKILDGQYFVHPSQKYLINCAHIERVSDKVVMKDGRGIDCSRGKKSEVRRIFNRYMKEMEHCLSL